MSSALSGIPVDRRRHLAAILGLFAALCVAVGVVATTGRPSGFVRLFSTVALVTAVALGLIAWGVVRTVKIDLEDARLDGAISDAIAAGGHSGLACGCAHHHDADELHVTAGGCEHDGSGDGCDRDCDTCVLAAMRPSPRSSRAERLAQ